jgi:glycosyltransferase involved in cell wall biosynthesis
MTTAPRRVSLVIPAYNEGEAIVATLAAVEAAFDALPYQLEIVVVNDGSRDDTAERVRACAPRHAELVLVDLSRNFGKEAALSAGLEAASGAAVIPFDADLQDPPELLARMLELWEQGAEVVLAHRSDRSSDGWLKRATAAQFYRLINQVSEVPIPEDVGDFRLMDRAVVDTVNALRENRRFMKGLFAWAGYRTAQVDYVRARRAAGDTKFNGLRLVNLAIEGITSFSTAPLRVVSYFGMLVALFAFCFGAWIVLKTLLYGVDMPGYASTISIVLFMSGVQMVALGVIGEYVGRTYLESKQRPPFVVRQVWRRRGGAGDPSSP